MFNFKKTKTLEERKARLQELANNKEVCLHIAKEEVIEMFVTSIELGHLLALSCMLGIESSIHCNDLPGVIFTVEKNLSISLLHTAEFDKFSLKIEKEIKRRKIVIPIQTEDTTA